MNVPWESVLPTLPTDILLHVCRQATERDLLGHLDDLSRQYLIESSAGSLRGLTDAGVRVPIAGHSLSCCKSLRLICNNMRTSISFRAEEQASALPYMQKLPHLSTVTITYSNQSCNFYASLTSLHTHFPCLTSLTLKFEAVEHKETSRRLCEQPDLLKRDLSNFPPKFAAEVQALRLREANLAALLLPWAGTLQCLELENIRCTPTVSAGGSGLRFLSQMQNLQALSLRLVAPTLVVEDIAGCTGLLELTLLHTQGGHQDTLDLSAFTKLQQVNVQGQGLKQLNVDGLTSLWSLKCNQNRIVDLHLSTHLSLRRLSCSSNRLTHLDMATCPQLQILECSYNPLIELRVKGCTQLTGLSCVGKFFEFEQLHLSTCTALQSLRIVTRHISTHDLQSCQDLHLLSISNIDGCTNPIGLNLTGLTKLQQVSFENIAALGMSIISLDMTGCTSLKQLHCGDSKALAALCVSRCSGLQTLMLEGCHSLRSLDLEGCVQLHTLHCREIPLESLDLSACARLTEIKCSGSNIRRLDVSSAAATLKTVHSDRCQFLEVLNATGCRELEALWCGKCPLLRELSCQGCDTLPSIWCRDSGRFDGQTLALLRASDWKVEENRKCV